MSGDWATEANRRDESRAWEAMLDLAIARCHIPACTFSVHHANGYCFTHQPDAGLDPDEIAIAALAPLVGSRETAAQCLDALGAVGWKHIPGYSSLMYDPDAEVQS